MPRRSTKLAYLVGVALGDGNLSNPNGRAIRLRITCDESYPRIKDEIIATLRDLFPKNKVSVCKARTGTYSNISIYSNMLSAVIPWKVGMGTKLQQKVSVPSWILKREVYMAACLRGLLQTDGSIYVDRGYTMINFVNHSAPLAHHVCEMMRALGFSPHIYTVKSRHARRYTVRISKDAEVFLKKFDVKKR